MSKRCELQKEYYKEFGNYKGEGKYSDHYVNWLESRILALTIHVVVKQGELLSCGSCKGTDLRKKGDNYYVCNYCGNTMTT